MINHFALFDILFLGQKLQYKRDDFAASEIQLLCYLSCLLSIYNGKTSNDWGYRFSKNESGYPLSVDINKALNFLLKKGMLEGDDKYFRIVESGSSLHTSMSMNSQMYGERLENLEASVNCTSMLPFGAIQVAIHNDPIITSSKSKNSALLLAENIYSTSILHEQFKDLKVALGDQYKSLIIPAITWMSGNLKQQLG